MTKFGSYEQVWSNWVMRPPRSPCPSGTMLGPYGGLGTSLAMIDTSVVHWWLPSRHQWYMNGVQWCTMNVYEMMWVVCLHIPRLLWMALKVKWTQETQICCCAKWFWWQKSKWQKWSFHHRDASMSFPLGLWVIEHVWVTEITNNDMSSRPSGNGIGFVKVTLRPRIIKVCYQHW
jgi:hypothetical protein